MSRALLVSNSTLHGSEYLDHCELQIKEVFRGRSEVLFIPYARPGGITWDKYTEKARDRFEGMGFSLRGIHESDSPSFEVNRAKAIFIGGGNTFVLLDTLQRAGIMGHIKHKFTVGTPYLGTSAGSNVAGRTMMTTNDMPIVYPDGFDAIGIVPFVINPHYIDPQPGSTHMGEPRETRIREYHAFNDDVVVGLREGAMLDIQDDTVMLRGRTGAKVFRKGEAPVRYEPGEPLDFLMREESLV